MLARVGLVALGLFAASPAFAVTDDFNRPNAGTLGSGWTQQVGTNGISSNAAIGSSLSFATFNTGSGNLASIDYDIGTSGVNDLARAQRLP